MRTAASPRQKHALLGLSYVARRSLRAPHFRRSRSRRMSLPIRVCAAQRGRDFVAPDLERGIHFRGVF